MTRKRRYPTIVFIGTIAIACGQLSIATAAPGDKVEDNKEPPAAPRPSTESKPPATMREAILVQRRALQSEKAELKQLKVDLKTAEEALDAKIKKLQAETKKKEELIKKIKSLREAVLDEKLARLVRLAEKMPPAEAAAYLSKLDEPTASSILQGMRIRQASKVMSALNPKKAASLSRTYLKDDKPVGRRSGGNKPK